ncbi:MAG: flagellin lysine-N-methylase [Oscillospiraceae bacterium]|nr:flagellin lysine-N-methylase [Oscillospiraceae bacterium]
MRLCTPDYYESFHCIAHLCEDTCCAAWEVVVDEASAERYRACTAPIGEKLRACLHHDGEDYVFPLKDGRCPFLRADLLCELHAAIGEENLCRTCALYPRHIEVFGDRKEVGLGLSCPEVARMVMVHETPITFPLSTVDEAPDFTDDLDGRLYFSLFTARKTAFAIAQDRSYSVAQRAALLLVFARRIQSLMNRRHIGDILPLAADFLQEDTRRRALRSCRGGSCTLPDIIKAHRGLEILTDRWQETLDTLAAAPSFGKIFGKTHGYENFLVYWIFRYFLKAVYDRELLWRMQWGVSGLALLLLWDSRTETLTDAAQADHMHLYSREVEHCEENIAALRELAAAEPFAVENLAFLLSSLPL